MTTDLLTPILGEIRNPHFFEGRLLTGSDLQADQEAHRARQRQLGRALGAGIVEGLWVDLVDRGADDTTPILSVSGGLALNRKGQALELAKAVEIRLTASLQKPEPEASLFKPCQKPSEDLAATGEGIYLLVLSPASAFRERAPMRGLGSGKAGAGCGSRWAVEGVRLRLEPWNPLTTSDLTPATRRLLQNELLGADDEAATSKLRNVLAYLCLGTEALASFAADPFARESGQSALESYGPIDDLTATERLDDCDVPLALVHWTLTGLRFIDNWAVRRRPSALASSPDWPTLSGGRRRGEGEAVLFQFQNHLDDLLKLPRNPGLIRALDYFLWVPAAGLLPTAGAGRPRGFGNQFFDGLNAPAPEVLPGALLRPTLRDAADHPPLRLSTGSKKAIRRFEIAENRQAQPDGSPYPPFVLFTRQEILSAGSSGSTITTEPDLFGNVDVEWETVSPETLGPGQTATFGFQITSRASTTAGFLIEPRVVVEGDAAPWNEGLQVLDSEGRVLTDPTVPLAPEASADFQVRLDIPDVPGGTTFDLIVDASAGRVRGTSGSLPFELGGALVLPDETISLTPSGAIPASALFGNQVLASAGQTVTVRLAVTVQVVGTYDLRIELPTSTTGWEVERGIFTPDHFDVDEGDFAATGSSSRILDFEIQSVTPSATSPGRVDIVVQRRGNEQFRTLGLTLKLLTS